MALIPDSLAIRPIDGTAYRGVVNDATTQIGLYVELDGEAVAVDSGCTCTLRHGSTTVAATVSVATVGEVTASVTAANLTTLGATMLSGVVATFSGTVSSGARVLRYEMPFIVMDRGQSVPVTLAELKTDIPQLNNAATIPASQTNLWPQVINIAQQFRSKLDAMGGEMKTYLLTNPAEMASVFRSYAKAGIYRYLAGNDNGQSHLWRMSEFHMEEYREIVAGLKATIKTGTGNLGDADARKKVQVVQAKTYAGSGLYDGGPL